MLVALEEAPPDVAEGIALEAEVGEGGQGGERGQASGGEVVAAELEVPEAGEVPQVGRQLRQLVVLEEEVLEPRVVSEGVRADLADGIIREVPGGGCLVMGMVRSPWGAQVWLGSNHHVLEEGGYFASGCKSWL